MNSRRGAQGGVAAQSPPPSVVEAGHVRRSLAQIRPLGRRQSDPAPHGRPWVRNRRDIVPRTLRSRSERDRGSPIGDVWTGALLGRLRSRVWRWGRWSGGVLPDSPSVGLGQTSSHPCADGAQRSGDRV